MLLGTYLYLVISDAGRGVNEITFMGVPSECMTFGSKESLSIKEVCYGAGYIIRNLVDYNLTLL
jgi:hypothetical protein